MPVGWVAGVTPLSAANLNTMEADLATHAALTIAHGATGAVVGTTNVQVLTNKTLTAPTLNGTTVLGATPIFDAGADDVEFHTTETITQLWITTREDASGPKLSVRHVSTTPAVNDHIFTLSAQGYDLDTPQNLLEYLKAYVNIEDPTADHADGDLEIHLLRDQVITLALTLSSLGDLVAARDIETGRNIIFSDASVQATKAMVPEVFVPVDSGNPGSGAVGTIGYRGAVILNANGEICYFKAFVVPSDFTSLTSCKVLCSQTDADPSIDWTFDTTFAAVGEAYNTHTDTATADALVIPQNQMHEIDVTAAFTGLLAGDSIGARMTLDVVNNPGSNLYVFGYTFIYA